MIFIQVNPSLQISLTLDDLEHTVLAVLKNQASDGDITIVLTDDDQLRELNREYLGIDTTTDVLSFPATETDPETERCYLGDILISIPRAAEQAHDSGHALGVELKILLVHGTLHLLGYDHSVAREKAQMWKVQTKILESLDIPGQDIRES